MKHLITAEELSRDLSNYLIIDLREPQEYEKSHITGALPIPVDPLLNDETTALVPAWKFATVMSSLGASSSSSVVLYDDNLGRSSCRFWYAAKHYGHKDIFILEGGTKVMHKLPMASGNRTPAFSYYYPSYEPGYFFFLGELLKNYNSVKILDTRSKDEYEGGAMPMFNPRGGRLPGALHISHDQLMSKSAEKTFAPPEDVSEKLSALGISKEDTIVTYCQSGVRAALAGISIRNAGFENTIVYDGSMFEWSRCMGLKLENEVFAE